MWTRYLSEWVGFKYVLLTGLLGGAQGQRPPTLLGRSGVRGRHRRLESFHSLLQKNVLDQRPKWATRSEFCYEIVAWIERTYNRRRRQRRLGRLTPVEVELTFAASHAA